MINRTDYYEHHESEAYLMSQFQDDFTHCDFCELSLSLEDATRFEEMFYCPSCAEAEGLAPCSWCGVIQRQGDMDVMADGIYCKGCYLQSEGVKNETTLSNR